MPKLYLEKTVELEKGRKLYFTSYLRRDFIERSAVITLDGKGRIGHLYLSSYRHGSVEWNNGSGLTECRVWETEDQAREPTYLTRRYTTRLSDGAADDGYAATSIIPDVLDNMADGEVARLLKKVISRNTSVGTDDITLLSLRRRPRSDERRMGDSTAPVLLDVPLDPVDSHHTREAGGISPFDRVFSMIAGSPGIVRDALKRITPQRTPDYYNERNRETGGAENNSGDDMTVRDRAEKARRTARRITGKKKR